MIHPLNITDLENVLKLMNKYRIDEFASEHFTVKKTEHRQTGYKKQSLKQEIPNVAQNIVTAHLQDAPWEEITDAQVDELLATGKVASSNKKK